MFVTFYKNSSDKLVLNKRLSIVGLPVQCQVKDPCTLTRPIITITKSALKGWERVNYAYIDEFDRYYFMGTPTMDTAGRLTVELTVDPLMSNKAAILGVKCVIMRSETVYNKMIRDDKAPVRASRAIQYKEIGTFPSSECYVITCDGGKRGES